MIDISLTVLWSLLHLSSQDNLLVHKGWWYLKTPVWTESLNFISFSPTTAAILQVPVAAGINIFCFMLNGEQKLSSSHPVCTLFTSDCGCCKKRWYAKSLSYSCWVEHVRECFPCVASVLRFELRAVLICIWSIWGQGSIAEVVASALDPLSRKVRVALTSWYIPALYRKHILENMTY